MDEKTYQFYVNHDLSQYAGKWVAMLDEQVIASGDTATEVLSQAKKKAPDRTPALARVPKGEVLVLCRR
jgi:hypothetical protein